MFGLGLPELIVIFVVILLLFGAKALPEVAKGLGQALRIFKKETAELTAEPKEETETKTTETKAVEDKPSEPKDQS